MNLKKEVILISGMTCLSCKEKIEKKIRTIEGVVFAEVDLKKNELTVVFDSDRCSTQLIKQTIIQLGYNVGENHNDSIINLLIMILAMILLFKLSNSFDLTSILQNQVSYLILFIIGILTSFHCIGMCGGIMFTQTLKANGNTKKDKVLPAIEYNLGRVVSYTLIGGIFGAFGAVFNISYFTKSLIMVFAGIFMVIMGLNLIGFRVISLRNNLFLQNVKVKKQSKRPFIIGLLNGLMPCGPLQAMQLYAISTGSFIGGATAMFIFAMGTLPIMLGFGVVSSFINKNNTKTLFKYSGIFIIILGVIMAGRGIALSGFGTPNLKLNSIQNKNYAKASIQDGYQVVEINATIYGYLPNVIYVKKGLPVKFIINGKELTSCNRTIVIPSLNKEINLEYGQNIIEFTPDKNQDIRFSCWMGMLNGVIKVVDDLDNIENSYINVPNQSQGCCSIPQK